MSPEADIEGEIVRFSGDVFVGDPHATNIYIFPSTEKAYDLLRKKIDGTERKVSIQSDKKGKIINAFGEEVELIDINFDSHKKTIVVN